MGALTATGTPNLLALAASVTAGGMAGDRLTYLIGRKAGGRLRNRRLLSAKGRAEQALLRYGGAAFAGSPLLGAAFGMGVGLLLGGTHLVVEKLRAHRPATAGDGGDRTGSGPGRQAGRRISADRPGLAGQ